MISCKSTYLIQAYDGPEVLEFTNFCELDEEESGAMIATVAYYTGVEEYWGLTSNTKCELDHKVYLNIEENYQKQLNTRLAHKLTYIHKNYWKYSLKMEIIGRIDKTNEELGYGHLGIKKIQVTPYQIRSLGKDKLNQDEKKVYR